MIDRTRIGGVFSVECNGPDGRVKWVETCHNLVVNEGLNFLLNSTFHGTTQVTTWYCGLKNTGTIAAADTLASHSGWTENSNYAGNRKAYEEAAASGQSMTNSASKAVFTISADSQTIAGAFLCSAETGTSGTLFCVADFASAKSADNGDVINLTYQLTAADAT